MQIKKNTFSKIADNRGFLTAIEAEKDISFAIKRVYYLYGNKYNQRRGFHAHKRLQQYLICVNGSCRVMLDDGKEKAEVLLDSPNEGLYVGAGMWREMYDFSEDAVLLVLASEHYDENDYIRDYNEFIKVVNKE